MPDTVIRVQTLGKKFIIGHQVRRDGLFRDAMMQGLRNFWRKGTDLFSGRPIVEGDVAEEFWALQDINFEVKAGELISIIGHNGAGKTTLLKILSRITEPTTGRVEINGRVASLLEVGTGFHPELSGRENVFLNGAILGMSRAEVRRRFDDIVEFAGVEKFIDMPVKRFSTGMYARLAFAVAAHLQAEILIVDEVLAVGDAEFQARCLNRMSEVANSGRTVLFVSHNLAAVTALTRRAIVLRGGRLSFDGPVDAALADYTAGLSRQRSQRNWGKARSATLISADLLDEHGKPTERYVPGTPLRFHVVLEATGIAGMSLELVLRDGHNLAIGYYTSNIFSRMPIPTEPGVYECTISLESLFLAAGQYGVDLLTTHTNVSVDHEVDNAIRFFVDTCNPHGIAYNFSQDEGNGNLALNLSAPLRFTPLSAAAAAQARAQPTGPTG